MGVRDDELRDDESEGLWGLVDGLKVEGGEG